MVRMWIGLALAVIIVVVICVGLNHYLSDYLIDNGSWLPGMDWERFLYDACNTFVDSLYETTASESVTEPSSASQTT